MQGRILGTPADPHAADTIANAMPISIQPHIELLVNMNQEILMKLSETVKSHWQ